MQDAMRDNTVAEVLEHPSDFIESRDYMSWERSFIALLVDKTKDTYLRYSKSKLNESYKNQKVQEKILQEIPEKYGLCCTHWNETKVRLSVIMCCEEM